MLEVARPIKAPGCVGIESFLFEHQDPVRNGVVRFRHERQRNLTPSDAQEH